MTKSRLLRDLAARGIQRSRRRDCLMGSTFLVVLFSFASLPGRADVLIDFEGFPGMSNTIGLAVPALSQVSTQFLATDGVLFSSASPFVAAVNLGGGHATSGSKGIGGATVAGNLVYGIPIDAEFFLPGDPTTLGETDFVSVRGDRNGVGGLVTLQAFDFNGMLLGTNVQVDLNGPTLQISAIGIHSVSFFSATPNVAFDDFIFGPVRAVPEPSLVASLGGGLLGLGAASRGRRRARPAGDRAVRVDVSGNSLRVAAISTAVAVEPF